MSELAQRRFKYNIHFLVQTKLCNPFRCTTLLNMFPRYTRAFPILHRFIAINFAFLGEFVLVALNLLMMYRNQVEKKQNNDYTGWPITTPSPPPPTNFNF